MNKIFAIAVEKPSDDSAFGVVFPDVPGCHSAGDTLDIAIAEAKEALIGFMELCREDGDDIPEPKGIEFYVNDEEYKDYIWSFVEIDITPFMGKSKKVNVTLPEYLINKIDSAAKSNPEYKTRSGFLAAAAERELALITH